MNVLFIVSLFIICAMKLIVQATHSKSNSHFISLRPRIGVITEMESENLQIASKYFILI